MKTCYRCGKTYNTKKPYCRACMIEMDAPKEEKLEKKGSLPNGNGIIQTFLSLFSMVAMFLGL